MRIRTTIKAALVATRNATKLKHWLAPLALIGILGLSACTPEQIAASRAAGIPISAEQEQILLAIPNRYVHPDPNVDRWHDTAIQAGWPEDAWQWLSCVVSRESHGFPDVVYYGSRDRSYGLMQINALAWHRQMVEYAGSESAFTDPAVNLSFAYTHLYLAAGKSPWVSRYQPC